MIDTMFRTCDANSPWHDAFDTAQHPFTLQHFLQMEFSSKESPEHEQYQHYFIGIVDEIVHSKLEEAHGREMSRTIPADFCPGSGECCTT